MVDYAGNIFNTPSSPIYKKKNDFLDSLSS